MALAGCSYTFGVEPEDVRLEGAPLDRHRLDPVPLAGYAMPLFTKGHDGAAWAVGPFYSDVAPFVTSAVCVRLAPPVSYVEIGNLARIGAQALYRFDAPLDLQGALDLVRLHPEGDEERFAAPRSSQAILESDDGNVAALLATDGVELLRLDGSFQRFVSERADGALGPSGGLLDPAGEWLLTRGEGDAAILRSTRGLRDVTLAGRWGGGVVPSFDDERAQVIFCNGEGLKAAPVDGGPARVLDPAPCAAAGKEVGAVLLRRGWAYYRVEGVLEAAPLDGSGPPRELAAPGVEVLALGSGRAAVATGTTPPWAGQASDGWLEGHRFMERGSRVSFSRDGTRLRWLEHAADEDAVGELRSIAVDELLRGGRSLLLARNVVQYAELDDGRVLAIANRAYEGLQSRLEVIDEQARVARPIVEGAKRFVRVPDDRQVLVTLVTERPGSDDDIVIAPVEAR